MINYKLAKQLNEAGFKRGDDEHKDCWIGDNYVKEPNDVICHPTLSELIDACGDKFGRLDKFVDVWEIEGGKRTNVKTNSFEYLTQGKTPEETVAKLWLKLNEKKL